MPDLRATRYRDLYRDRNWVHQAIIEGRFPVATTRLRRREDGWADASNAELLGRCKSGDSAAWREIVRRYERLVYSIPMREGLGPDQASDITQTTFTHLCAGIDDIRDPERLAWWLMTVTRRQVWRAREARRTEPRNPDEFLDLLGEDESVDQHDRTLWVHEAVVGLGEPCRSIITEMFLASDEPTYAEIADRVSVPVGTVGPMRGRCLARLRQALEAAETT